MSTAKPAWYREPTMLIVAGVLTFTLLSGTTMMTLSLTDRDVLTMNDSDYRAWRDEMRATTPTSSSTITATRTEGHD